MAQVTTSRWWTTASKTRTCSLIAETYEHPALVLRPDGGRHPPTRSRAGRKACLTPTSLTSRPTSCARPTRPAKPWSTTSLMRPSRRAPAAGPRSRRSNSACRSRRSPRRSTRGPAEPARAARRRGANSLRPRATPRRPCPPSSRRSARRSTPRRSSPTSRASSRWRGEGAVRLAPRPRRDRRDLARRLHHPRRARGPAACATIRRAYLPTGSTSPACSTPAGPRTAPKKRRMRGPCLPARDARVRMSRAEEVRPASSSPRAY